jgi:glycosyltransferase involved in cell wall biosynthesis
MNKAERPAGDTHLAKRRAIACDQVVASVAEAGAGPSYSVPALTDGLFRLGVDVRLHAVQGWRVSGDTERRPSHLVQHAQDWPSVPVVGRLCFSRGLLKALSEPSGSPRILHTHGLWLMPNVYPAWAKAKTGAALVMSPRGMLGAEALMFSAWKKAAFWMALQRRAVRSADCLHATSDEEHQAIRAAGLAGPVAVIRNGIATPAAARPRTCGAPRTVLSLGRIHPKKGLDQLVRAWARIEPDHPDWTLRIIGPAELRHDEELRALSAELGLGRVSVEGPVYGAAKSAIYAEAGLFVLPTRNENFAMTVAEALAHGVPVISSKGAPWAGLETERCGWWVDGDPDAIAATLRSALTMPAPQLAAMGERGRDWMARDFSWSAVAAEMQDVYTWLAGAGDRPATVHLD